MMKKRILIVEDEVLVSMCMKLDLTDLGYEVCSAVTTGEQALEAFSNLYPDLVLLDISLAGDIDGLEAARRMKEIRDVPIIFMTGFSDLKLKEEAMRIGPAAYLLKPVDREEMCDAIAAALGVCS